MLSNTCALNLLQNAVKIAVGVAGSILSIVVIAVLTLVCAYCCVVKYKMCTPIHDPTQEMPYRYNDTNTVSKGYAKLKGIFQIGVNVI